MHIPRRLQESVADRYRFERELGQGGMATVYLAEDLKHRRQVAVKVLKPELGAVLGAERFLNEIRTTATLQHPNLLPLFDSGEADGLLYYVMPFVEGETLRARLEFERQLPVDTQWRAAFRSLGVSPDGTRLAIALEVGGRVELWVKALPAGPLSRLAYDGILNYRPAWHDGGRSILFASDRSGAPQLYSIPADGSAPAVLVRSDPQAIDEGELSADGRWLTYRTGSGGNRDVYVVGTRTDTTPIPVATTEYEEYSPAFSPDARALAYVSAETGRPEVYFRPLATTTSGRVQVSVGGGDEPSWSNDGREIFYRNSAGELTSAQVVPDADFRITSRRTLFSLRGYAREYRSRMLSVAPDDQSFYLVREASEERNASEFIVVQNWFQELDAKMKAGR